MIERSRAREHWNVMCDRCTHEEQMIPAYDFRHLIDTMKQEGWKIQPHPKVRGEWEHFCPNCIEEENTKEVDHNGY